MNCYTWMELMKQGLEVLWWKHNMIPTKESIQQTWDPSPSKHPPTPGQPPTSETHCPALILPPLTYLFTPFWLKPDWTSEGSRLVDEAQKATAKVFTSNFSPVLHRGFFQRRLTKKEKSGRPLKSWRVPKSCHAWWIPTLGTHFHSGSSGHTSRTPTFRGLFYFYKCRRGTQVLSPRLIWASTPLFNSTPPSFFSLKYPVSTNANERIHAG